MRPNPIWQAFRFLAAVAVVCVAAYFVIDAVDESRRQARRVEQSLIRVTDTLDRLSLALIDLRESGPRGRDGDVPPAARSGNGSDAFANDDLRDPLEEEGGSVVSRTLAFPGNLNNVISSDAITGSIWGMLVDSLATANNNDLTRFEPLMAESWEVSPDGLIYTIRLRKNVLWQSYTDPVTGREVPAKLVTANDFLFYWNTIQNPRVPCEAIRNYYEMLDRIEVVDDHTFNVIWKEPYSLGETFTLAMSPLPEHYYRPDPEWSDDRFAEEFAASPRNQWIVGTGPYRLVKWDKNEEVVLERDENYYGRKPPIRTRRMRLIPDNSVSFMEFKRGQLTSYGLLPTQWHEETPEPEFQLVTPSIENAYGDSLAWDRRKRAGELPEDYKFEKFQTNGVSWSFIGYNMQRPLFRDRLVRTALTHLIDRQRILDEVYMGLGTIISGPFVPQSPYYNHDVKPLPFDIEKARRLLAEAGWEDTDDDGILDKDYDNSGVRKPFVFTFIIPSSSTLIRKWAAIIEQDMLKARIKAEIKPIEWSVYTQALDQRDFDVCSLLWSGGVEGDPYQLWHGSGVNREASSNYVAYSSPEADRLIEEGRRTVDKRKRYAIYHRLHEVIARDQPYTFLVAGTSVSAQSRMYRNAIVYKGGGMDGLLQWIPRSLQEAR